MVLVISKHGKLPLVDLVALLPPLLMVIMLVTPRMLLVKTAMVFLGLVTSLLVNLKVFTL
jgi:hypothetical protein